MESALEEGVFRIDLIGVGEDGRINFKIQNLFFSFFVLLGFPPFH